MLTNRKTNNNKSIEMMIRFNNAKGHASNRDHHANLMGKALIITLNPEIKKFTNGK